MSLITSRAYPLALSLTEPEGFWVAAGRGAHCEDFAKRIAAYRAGVDCPPPVENDVAPTVTAPAMSGQGVGALSDGLVLAFENGPGLDVGVCAVTLHGVPHATFSWLEESLPRFLLVLLSKLLELGGFLGLLLPRLLLSGPSVALGLLSGLLGLLRGLHLLAGPLHFVGGAFQRNFHAHRLYPLPGECCGQRTNKNANCDLQNVVHLGTPFFVSL